MIQIKWLTNFDIATSLADHERKPILLEFVRANCAGCQKMEHRVFVEPTIADIVMQNFIPLRQDVLADRTIRSRYAAIWTPSFYFLNYDGKLLWFSEGPLAKEDFETVITIGRARYLLHRGRYEAVIDLIDQRLEARPDDPRGPQLVFTRGMAYYLRYGDKDAFHAAMEEIVEKYPASPEARMWPWEGQYPEPQIH